mmetsp:Transcript_39200/g.120950  ORF Transcript_39200/g.120950 Transcript_39200/m.120950 type:complete len:211 (-) Transcript_39200:26-658(-)
MSFSTPRTASLGESQSASETAAASSDAAIKGRAPASSMSAEIERWASGSTPSLRWLRRCCASMLSTVETNEFCLQPCTFCTQPTKPFICRFAATSGCSGTGGRMARMHLSSSAQAESNGPPSTAAPSDGQPCGQGGSVLNGFSKLSIGLGKSGSALIGGISTGIEYVLILGGRPLHCQSCNKLEASAMIRQSPLLLTSKPTAPSVGELRQ